MKRAIDTSIELRDSGAESGRPSRRPHLLLSAFACSPYRGSEAGVGWNRAIEAAKVCDTWVLCEQDDFGSEIRRYQDEHGEVPGLTFVFVPRTRLEIQMEKNSITEYLSYRCWHHRAFKVARELHQKIAFDLVHHVTFNGFREPSYLWKLDVPFVWGPVGGTQNYPAAFLSEAPWRVKLSESIRSVANNLQLRYSSRVRKAVRKVDAFFSANSTIQQDFRRVHGLESIRLQDIGIKQVTAWHPRDLRDDATIRILWSGLLIPRKALHLLIDALAQLPAGVKYELRVLGDGPSRNEWERLAQRRGVDNQITWLGWTPYDAVTEHYEWADVFVFTSLRDTSGMVNLEALGASLPVICLDHQGVKDIVTDQCGVKIPVTTPHKVTAELAAVIALLANDPERLQEMSRHANERTKLYLWSYQANLISEIYQQVLVENRSDCRIEVQGVAGADDPECEVTA